MAKKMYIVAVVALLVVFTIFAVSSEAKKQTFGALTVDLPNGWEVVDEEKQITFTAPDGSAELTIIVEATEGATLKDIAEGLAKDVNGSKPKKTADGFEFTFKGEGGVDCECFVTGDEEEGYYVFIGKAGDHPQMEALMDSIEIN